MHDNYSICLLNTKSFCHGLKAVLYDIEWKSFFLAQPWKLTFKVSLAVALNGKISESFSKSQIYTKLRIAFFLQGGFKVQKVTKSNFSEKKNHLGEKPKISSKIGFLVFDENLIYWPVFCTLKWHGEMLFMTLQKQYFWGKSGSPVPWFSVSPAQNAVNQSECRSLWSTTYLGGVNRYLRFLHSHKGKAGSGTTFSI